MSKTAVAFATVAGIFFLALVMVTAFISFGWLDINWPWENIVQEESAVGVEIEQGPARIIEITPIALDCRARIEAEVPVIGTQKTSVAGATISTDTIRMRAVGDVDTCVDASGVEIIERADGTFAVIIDADAIRFVRPRVDAVATMESVATDRGFVNQVVEVLPWTNEDDELTPAAFAFAQTVIGGSSCMEAAYERTTVALERAYRDQMTAQGALPGDVDVIVSGIPDFGQNDLDTAALGEFEFVEDQGTSCVIVTP
ncbi:MAG: hypothetical protein ACI81L_002358 [Verrucomicrobiales bacterium]|jgi:hypothetical protein